MDAAFEKYLIDTLLLKDSHVAALLAQGLVSFDDLQLLEEEDVKKICQICRRPGGTLPDTKDSNNNVTKGGNDPGIAIPLMIERRLKMLWYYT